MRVDMSPEAITQRMYELNQLWELTVALKSSEIVEEPENGQKQTKAEESIDDRNKTK